MKPLILKGKLHRFKNNLKDVASKYNVNITKNGIPVVTKQCEEGTCKLIQSSEIESGELIFNAKDASKLEELALEYNETKDDEILLKIGERLKTILSKTKDETGKFQSEIEMLNES